MDNASVLDSLVSGASHISVAVHTHPDGDALGSGLALVGYLARCRGKDAVLLVPDSVPQTLSFILKDFGGCPVKDCSDDPAGVFGRIAASDLLFCLDCSSFARTGAMESHLREATAPKVLIDHHLSPDREAFGTVFSETEVSSTCELLLGILKEMPDVHGDLRNLPDCSLRALLTGITTDTNNFANSVFPGTLEAVQGLMEAGVDRDAVLSDLYNHYRENRIRLMGYLLHENLTVTPEGAALMVLDRRIQKEFDFRQGETEGFVNLPLSIDGVRLSIFLTEEDDRFRVSVRSKRGTSANACASRYFHGGGHELASGGKLFFPGDIPSPEDAKAYILKVTREFLKG